MRKTAEGQTVYVLMSLESTGTGKNSVREWRPVAVVSNPDLANQWYEYGTNVDWVPLELDAVSNISPENMPSFQPRKTTPGEQKAVELSQKMEATITRMQKVIEDQAALIEKLQKRQKSSAYESPMLKESADKIPPKPVEKIKGGSQPFPETLDAQGIADYIETYANYPVNNEFVYEQFRGKHAMLKLVPISHLKEGGRDQNLQSKANESKYLRQSIKTQPPAVVENGKVMDGNHRLRANKRNGWTHMWCYTVMGEDNGEANGSSGQED